MSPVDIDERVAPVLVVFVLTVVAVAVIDLREHRLPRRLIVPVAAASVVWLGGVAAIDGDPERWAQALASAGGASGILLVLHLARPRGLGYGDVRLVFLVGLVLGWFDIGAVVLALLLAAIAGAVSATALVATGVMRARDPLPFGPFLATGALVALLAGRA
jgi:leader peptidase (prepilin peptidase)/N-methyltransferase